MGARFAILTLCLALTGCLGAEQNLFRRWNADGEIFDLSDYGFGSQVVAFEVAEDEYCTCALTVDGDEQKGEIRIHDCQDGFIPGGPNWAFEGACTGWDIKYSYENSGGELELCEEGASCKTFL